MQGMHDKGQMYATMCVSGSEDNFMESGLSHLHMTFMNFYLLSHLPILELEFIPSGFLKLKKKKSKFHLFKPILGFSLLLPNLVPL